MKVKIEKECLKPAYVGSSHFKENVVEIIKKALDIKPKPEDSDYEKARDKISKEIESYLADPHNIIPSVYEKYTVGLEAAAYTMNSSIGVRVDCSILVEQCEGYLENKLHKAGL